MAANLVRRYDEEEAVQLLNRSFAQYQADRSVVQLEQRLRERRNLLADLRKGMSLPAEGVAELRALRRRASEARAPGQVRRRAIETAIAGLGPGTVIQLERHGGGPAVVVSVGQRRSGAVRLRALTPGRRLVEVLAEDFEAEPARLGEIELPRPYVPNNRHFQDEVVRRLARARLTGGRGRRGRGAVQGRRRQPDRGDEEVGPLWELAEAHPLAGHPEAESALRQLARVERIEREVLELSRRVGSASDTVGRHFRRLLELLEGWGYVDGWRLSARGELLARCYHECDLLVVESLTRGLLDGLDPPTLAALASVFSYEHRSRTLPQQTWLPSARSRDSYRTILDLSQRLQADEQLSRLPVTREPDATFAGLAYAWASGSVLDDVLEDEEVSGGDFVRNVKQLLDLCRQLADLAAEPATAAAAARASDQLFRGVVAVSSTIGGADDDVPVDDMPVDGPPVDEMAVDEMPVEDSPGEAVDAAPGQGSAEGDGEAPLAGGRHVRP
ncbi:MAG: hypothetical protein GEV08_12665 [Acidimicrobiia bacterium]|nr:hypothetical protein [Acidimicrobiia bacterium]